MLPYTIAFLLVFSLQLVITFEIVPVWGCSIFSIIFLFFILLSLYLRQFLMNLFLKRTNAQVFCLSEPLISILYFCCRIPFEPDLKTVSQSCCISSYTVHCCIFMSRSFLDLIPNLLFTIFHALSAVLSVSIIIYHSALPSLFICCSFHCPHSPSFLFSSFVSLSMPYLFSLSMPYLFSC